MDTFTKAYIIAAMWSTNDESGNPLDDNHDADDISPELLAKITADCKTFQTANAHLWADGETGRGEWNINEQAGHDFWLTRNGHGVGFWDRPEIMYGKANADKLTEASQAFGEFDIYVDDGKIRGHWN